MRAAVTALALGLGSALLCGAAPPTPTPPKLPAAFSDLTGDQVVRAMFPSFRETSDYGPGVMGTIQEMRTISGQRAAIQWDDGGSWVVNGHRYLVVALGISDADSFCGACTYRGYIGVLERNGESLRVVASGETGGYGGHSDLMLDLAPYRLNDRETLIGLRNHDVWRGFNVVVLELYRVSGTGLWRVFHGEIARIYYPYDLRGVTTQHPFIDKSETQVSMIAKKPYNQLFLDTRIVRCRARDWDCDTNAKDTETVWIEGSAWNFDGQRFVEATQ